MKVARYAPYGVFLLVAAILFPGVVFLGHTLPGNGDRVSLEMPAFYMAARALKSWYLPVWDSTSSCGQVVLGFGLASPLSLLIMLLFPSDLELASSRLIVLEWILQAVGYYLFFERTWRDRALAVFSALAVSMSLYSLELHDAHYAEGLAFLPWVLLALEGWEGRRMRLNILLLSSALLLFLSNGVYQWLAYGLLFCGLFSLARCVARTGPKAALLGRWAFLWSCSLGLSLMYHSTEVFPFLWAAKSSVRFAMGYPAVLGAVQPLPAFAMGLLFPDVLKGPIGEGTRFWLGGAWPAYAGAASVLFCAIAVRRTLRKDVLPWALALLAVCVCAARTPFMGLTFALFCRSYLIHDRLTALAPLCIAFLAAAGMRLFLDGQDGFKRSCLIQSAALLALAALLAGGWLLPEGALRTLRASGTLSEWQGSVPTDLPALFRRSAGAFSLCGAGILVLMAARTWGRILDRGFKAGCVVLLAADLVWAAHRAGTFSSSTPSRHWFPPSPVTRFLDGLPDKGQYRFDLVRGAAMWSPVPLWTTYYPDLGSPFGYSDVGGMSTLANRRYMSLHGGSLLRILPAHSVDDPRKADLFAVKYFVTQDDPQHAAVYRPFTRPIYSDGKTLVLARPDAVPRFHLAYSSAPTPSDAESFRRAIHAPGVDLRSTVFIEDAGALPAGPPSRVASSDSLRMEEVRPGLLRGAAQTAQGAILVVTETFDPGWSAWVNGRPARIHRANYAFQAIALPPGRSEVEFLYRMPFHRAALACTALSAAVMAGLALWAAFAGRTPSHGGPYEA